MDWVKFCMTIGALFVGISVGALFMTWLQRTYPLPPSEDNDMNTRPEGPQVEARRRKCYDCKNKVTGIEHPEYCEAPQLAEVIDDSNGYRNTYASCQETRDFKFACGHDARWFVAKD